MMGEIMKNQKKIKMSKGKLWALGSLSVLAVAAFAAGCGTTPETKDITVEVGTEFDLYSLLGEEDIKSYREFSITQGDKKLAIDSNTVVFPKLGEYTVNYSTSKIWKVKTQDTTAPVVHITGSYLNLWSTDEVYLPAIVVNDNCDGNIQNYTVEVTSGGKTIPLSENNSFIATNAGPYTVKASAKDSSGNVGSASKDFTVLRKAEIIVKSGSTVAISDLDYRSALDTDKEYTFAYSVRVNGEDAPDVSATDGFTVADNSYYEIIATATNNVDPDDMVEFYTLFREEHVKMISFTGWNSADVTGTYNLICNPNPLAERTVVEKGGNYAGKIEFADLNAEGNYEKLENGWDSVLCAWTLRAWDNLAFADYAFSFDVTVRGKIKTDSPDDHINVKIGGFENENREFVINGAKGEYAEATFHYSSDTTSIYDLWATKDSVFFRLYFFRGQLDSLSFTLDNVRLTPKIVPMFTVENESVNIAAGENIPLSAGELGVTATDFFGAAVKKIECTQIMFGGADKTADWADGESIVSPQEGVYLLTFTATDFYGNTETKQITVTVGDKDYYAPSFSEYNRLNSVEKNTEITLGANGIANFVTVTDDAGFDLTYRVVKYGSQGAEELTNVTKFTVKGGEYYEVYMTATDKSDNHNVSYGYAIFAESAIAGRLNMLDGGTIEELGGGECNYNSAAGKNILRFYQFNSENIKYEKDEFGNGGVRLKVAGNAFQIMFYYSGNSGTQKARFTVRLETDLTDLSGELFSMNGVTITASDIGKDFVITTNFFSDAWGASIGFSASDLITFDGIKNKDVWVVIDNVEVFTPSAPVLRAENENITKDSGSGITFTAEALGMSGEDYFGNALANIKVTQVKVNGEVNASYTDGYVLATAPNGLYEVTFTATDRYGMTATKTVNVMVGDGDLLAPSFGEYNRLNSVEKNTEITLGANGITDFVTVTDEAGFDLTYRVVKHSADGAEELSNVTKFTVNGDEYYEVYMTATDKSDNANVSHGYVIFASNDIADRLNTLSGYTVETLVDGTTNLLKDNSLFMRLYEFPKEAYRYEADEFGNTSLKLKAEAEAKAFQIIFAYDSSITDLYVRFTVRLEGAQTDLNGASFTICGTTVTAGKTFVITTKLTEWIAVGGEISEPLAVSADGMKGKDVWAVLDNIEMYTPSAPTLTAENDSITQDSRTSITFTAEALGVSGEDYLGNELKELKVTAVKVNGEANATYTDGTVLQTAPNGIYEITFTGIDRYGMTATKTITVTVGDGDYTAPSFGNYDQLHSVAKGTEITLGANGIANFVTVTDDAGFDLTYRVVKYGAQGAEELTNVTKFTVKGGEYYEVYMTAMDKSDNQNTSYGYAVFAADDIASRINMLDGSNVHELGSGEVDLNNAGGELIVRFNSFTSETFVFETDGYGNKSFKLKAVTGKGFQIMFAYDHSKTDLRVCFTVRLEGAQTDLNGASFTICGSAVTAGKTFVISTKLTEWLAVGGGISEPLAVNTDGIKDKNVWVVIDNIEIFTPSAPALRAENNSIKQDSGTGITFTAEALGVSGEDYLGNALAELKVTQVLFNDEVNAAYVDGYELQNAPDGIYKVTFTGTDRYGMTANVTVTVKVGSTPPEITAEHVDNYVDAGTEIALTQTGIANHLTVTAEDDYSLSYRVMKNGAEEVANASSITIGAGEYYEVYVTATSGDKQSTGYILFAESSLNGVLKTLNGGTEIFDQAGLHCKQDGQFVFSTNAKKAEVVTNSDGSSSLCLSNIESGLAFFLPFASSTSVSVSFTLRIEGEFEGSGDLLTFKVGETTYFNVTSDQVGQTITVNYSSATWVGPPDNDMFAISGVYFTFDSLTVSELLASGTNVKIYIDNIIVRAQ